MILVMGKGRRERMMPVGEVVKAALWDYLQARQEQSPGHTALWVSSRGDPMLPVWIYRMIKRTGENCGIPNLHTHRFRHSYAMNAVRKGVSDEILRVVGGWGKIPETYFRTLAQEDLLANHREISPADRLGRKRASKRRHRPGEDAKGRL